MHVNILAMTATATASLWRCMIKTLGMQKIVMITENGDKTNIVYSVLPFESIETSFSKMIQRPSRKDENTENYNLLSNTRQVCSTVSVNEVSFKGREHGAIGCT